MVFLVSGGNAVEKIRRYFKGMEVVDALDFYNNESFLESARRLLNHVRGRKCVVYFPRDLVRYVPNSIEFVFEFVDKAPPDIPLVFHIDLYDLLDPHVLSRLVPSTFIGGD